MATVVKRVLFSLYIAISTLFLVWLLVSFIDVNLHNTLDRDGNPQGGTQWEYNAFVMMVENTRDT